MRLIYNFDGNDFGFEIDMSDAKDLVRGWYSDDEILNDYAQYLYKSEPSSFKDDLKREYGFDGTETSIFSMDDDAKDQLVDQVVFDLIDADVYNDELYDYYEEDAYNDFKDGSEEDELRYNYNRERL